MRATVCAQQLALHLGNMRMKLNGQVEPVTPHVPHPAAAAASTVGVSGLTLDEDLAATAEGAGPSVAELRPLLSQLPPAAPPPVVAGGSRAAVAVATAARGVSGADLPKRPSFLNASMRNSTSTSLTRLTAEERASPGAVADARPTGPTGTLLMVSTTDSLSGSQVQQGMVGSGGAAVPGGSAAAAAVQPSNGGSNVNPAKRIFREAMKRATSRAGGTMGAGATPPAPPGSPDLSGPGSTHPSVSSGATGSPSGVGAGGGAALGSPAPPPGNSGLLSGMGRRLTGFKPAGSKSMLLSGGGIGQDRNRSEPVPGSIEPATTAAMLWGEGGVASRQMSVASRLALPPPLHMARSQASNMGSAGGTPGSQASPASSVGGRSMGAARTFGGAPMGGVGGVGVVGGVDSRGPSMHNVGLTSPSTRSSRALEQPSWQSTLQNLTSATLTPSLNPGGGSGGGGHGEHSVLRPERSRLSYTTLRGMPVRGGGSSYTAQGAANAAAAGAGGVGDGAPSHAPRRRRGGTGVDAERDRRRSGLAVSTNNVQPTFARASDTSLLPNSQVRLGLKARSLSGWRLKIGRQLLLRMPCALICVPGH